MPIIEDAAGGVTGEPHRADPDLSDSVDKSTTHVASPEPLLDLSVTYPVPGVCVVQVYAGRAVHRFRRALRTVQGQ